MKGGSDMSHLEFKTRSQCKNANGLIILITEPKSGFRSKVIAITEDGLKYVVGICTHETEDVLLTDCVSYNESMKQQAIEKFSTI